MSARNGTAPTRSPARAKPRLVYFQRQFDRRHLVRYVQQHYDQQIKCFSHFFDVVVVQEDADFAEACDRHEADIALFDQVPDLRVR